MIKISIRMGRRRFHVKQLDPHKISTLTTKDKFLSLHKDEPYVEEGGIRRINTMDILNLEYVNNIKLLDFNKKNKLIINHVFPLCFI